MTMASWFDDEINRLRQSNDSGDGGDSDLSRERDEFRTQFERAIKDTVSPILETFVDGAKRHGFPSELFREADAKGRLRAVAVHLLTVEGAEATPLALETCTYKIALQMSTQRIAHMMNFQNRRNPRVGNQHDFRGLDSLTGDSVEEKLRRFLELSMNYCQGPASF